MLAALGEFDTPFVPVSIRSHYDGYSWAKLPTIGKVELEVGKTLHSRWLWSATLTCVNSLIITAHASDGKVFSAPVCMAKSPEAPQKAPVWADDHVLVTPEAQDRLSASEIWYHFGGWYDEGDTYETQEFDFQQELDRFWTQLIGPDEQLRRNILNALEGIKPAWQFVKVFANGEVRIRSGDGSVRTLRPPQARG